MSKNKKEIKYFEVRLYPNNKFESVETNNFHQSHLDDVFLKYNSDDNTEYHYLVCKEKDIKKTKQKIANYFLREAKIQLNVYKKRVNLFTKILSNVK